MADATVSPQGAAHADTVEHACPRCHDRLEWKGTTVHCPGCGRHWPIEHDVPQFCSDPPVWRLHRDEDFEEVIESCRKTGWREALLELEPEHAFNWIEGKRRSEGLLYTAIGPDKTVLDVGSGWGAMTMNMARLAREVHCIDNGPQGLRFINLRAQQAGLLNVKTSRSHAHSLPYADESFDLVVLSGVLEFVATPLPRLNPREAQRQVLAECRRVLKKGGQVYVALENRFSFHYLMGVSDEHTGLRWITPLPRWLGAIYHRLVLRRPFRHYIYSYWSLSSLIRSAGFKKPRIISPYRNYRDIDAILELDSPGMIKEWFDRFLYPTHRGRKLTSRLLIRLLKVALVCGLHHTPLLKLFPVTFFAIAEREDFNELP